MIQQMIQNMLGDYSKLITLLPNGQIRLNIIKDINIINSEVIDSIDLSMQDALSLYNIFQQPKQYTSNGTTIKEGDTDLILISGYNLQLTNLKISNMITEYKVIKPFGCAEVDDVFSYNKENENFIMSSEKTTDNTYSAKSMVISAKVIDNYVKAGLLSPTKEDKIDNNSDKVKKLYTEIKRLQNKYNQRNKVVEEKYEAGKMPTCQKVEHDTVYFNLMKVLNKFESIINE